MNINMNKKIIAISMGVAAIALVALPTFAQVGVNGSANASVTAGKSKTGANAAANLQGRITTAQNKGNTEITNRVEALNKLLTRVSAFKNLTDAQKAAITATVQTEITNLTTLEAKIAADTSTTTLKADMMSITQAYRIYALIVPQLNIVAASDRIVTVAAMMNSVGTKLTDRLNAATGLTNLTSLQATLADYNAKVIDANSQANAAVNEISVLQPDQGDKTVMASNTAALKDARAKVKTAGQDLVAARKDAQTIIQALKKSGNGGTASTTVQ